MTVNEEGNVISQIDHSERSSVDDITESQIENPLLEPTKLFNNDNVEDEEIEDVGEDVNGDKGKIAVPVDTTIKELKEENTNEDLVAEKRTNEAQSSSSRNKGNLRNKSNPDSNAGKYSVAGAPKTSSLKKGEMIEDKDLPVRTKGRKDGYSDGASMNERSAIHLTDPVSLAQSSETCIPGAFAVENPMHESSIRQEILESNRSMVLTGSSDSNSNVEETQVFHSTPLASVVLASSATTRQSRDDPEMGQHVVEAVCVQDQNIVEARIVTDDDDQYLGRQWSIQTVFFIAAFMLLGIMTISLIVVFTKRSQAGSPIEISTATESLDSVERIDALREILAPLSGDNVFDENSSEFSLNRRLALNWMVADTLLDIDDPSIEWKIRQRYIIVLFYISTNGSRWKEQFYFHSGLDECDWSSIVTQEFVNTDFTIKGNVCNRRGQVKKIRLWWNNLAGTLPHELSEFSDSLDEMRLEGGSISGHIPRSFEQLTNLETLTLHDNCLTGVIPDLSEATNLKKLWLSNNDGLSGSLNNFCNGSEVVAPLLSADCRGSVECDCCNCCNQDIHECCLQDGTCESSINLNALSPNNVLSSFDKQCLSEKSKQWIREECPCFYNKYNGTEGDDVGFQAVCTTECNAEGASQSYDF